MMRMMMMDDDGDDDEYIGVFGIPRAKSVGPRWIPGGKNSERLGRLRCDG